MCTNNAFYNLYLLSILAFSMQLRFSTMRLLFHNVTCYVLCIWSNSKISAVRVAQSTIQTFGEQDIWCFSKWTKHGSLVEQIWPNSGFCCPLCVVALWGHSGHCVVSLFRTQTDTNTTLSHTMGASTMLMIWNMVVVQLLKKFSQCIWHILNTIVWHFNTKIWRQEESFLS